MPSTLSPRQRQILDFILVHRERQGVSPSIREIQAHCKLASPYGVQRHLQVLTAKGLLRRLPGHARGLLPPGPTIHRSTLADVPLYGVIPAGLPTANEREPDRFLALDVTSLGLRQGTPVYALRVRGDSMTGASILDGDIVFLTPREPRPRDIVAALIDGESTLKRFIRHEGRACLRAENPRYPDLLPAVDLTIQGVMVGLLRATV